MREIDVPLADPALRMARVPNLLADAFGINTGEARRRLAEGGVRVDGHVLSLGKRRHARCQHP